MPKIFLSYWIILFVNNDDYIFNLWSHVNKFGFEAFVFSTLFALIRSLCFSRFEFSHLIAQDWCIYRDIFVHNLYKAMLHITESIISQINVIAYNYTQSMQIVRVRCLFNNIIVSSDLAIASFWFLHTMLMREERRYVVNIIRKLYYWPDDCNEHALL